MVKTTGGAGLSFCKTFRNVTLAICGYFARVLPTTNKIPRQVYNLVLVQPLQPERGLSLDQILDIVGLSYTSGSEVLQTKDWRGDKEGFRTPNVAYATWVDDGSSNLNIAPSLVRTSLVGDRRGGTILDGVFLYVADRGVLRHHYYLELPGSVVRSDCTPYLGLVDGEPGLSYRWFDTAHPSYGSVVAGRIIVTG